MRLILAIAVFLGSLGVATSGRLPGPRTARLTTSGSGQDHLFVAITDAPVRWTSALLKKRPTPTPVSRPAAPAAHFSIPTPDRASRAVLPLPAAHAGGAASRPASPRAPPRARS
ncbi:MAG TPA: hypothetical protein VGQ83_34275 [Polyangia bacterium]